MAQKRWRPFIAAGPMGPAARGNTGGTAGRAACDCRAAVRSARTEDRVVHRRITARAGAAHGCRGGGIIRSQSRGKNAASDPRLEPGIQEILAARPVEEDSFGYAEEERTFDLKRPALAVGGFVLAAGLIGAVSGLSLKDDV